LSVHISEHPWVETRLKGFRSSPQASFAYAFGFCLKKKKGRVEPFIWRKFDGLVKSLLKRHPGESRGPEHLEITGFRLSPE